MAEDGNKLAISQDASFEHPSEGVPNDVDAAASAVSFSTNAASSGTSATSSITTPADSMPDPEAAEVNTLALPSENVLSNIDAAATDTACSTNVTGTGADVCINSKGITVFGNLSQGVANSVADNGTAQIDASSSSTNAAAGALEESVVVTIIKTVTTTSSFDGEELEIVRETTAQEHEPKDEESDFVEDLTSMGWIPRGRARPDELSKHKNAVTRRSSQPVLQPDQNKGRNKQNPKVDQRTTKSPQKKS